MAANTNKADSPWATAFNLPNQLTILRLILSVIMFGFISQGYYLTSMVLLGPTLKLVRWQCLPVHSSELVLVFK